VIRCDALIVGGGPAGSTCARVLRRAGWDVAVADKARFPRDKVCAGWITPPVFKLLELAPADYRATGLTLQDVTGFRTGLMDGALIDTHYSRIVSYAVRRCEFDGFLLGRSGARVFENTPVTTVRRTPDTWVVNEAIETPVLVGAGGHFCPVSRHLRGGPDAFRPVVAKEAELLLDQNAAESIPEVPELFFSSDFEGYGWSVRKGRYLNIGIGRRDRGGFPRHFSGFISFLERTHRLPPGSAVRWRGHAYFADGVGARPVLANGALLLGDAAGLAYPESGEGIRPAIESGRLAAETLVGAGGRHDADSLHPYADALRRLYPRRVAPSRATRAISAAMGRPLFRCRAFTRHVLLDRWFLRTQL
jgi:flavin-dependent dehydrogenase